MAPTIRKGSFPDATASGSGESGGSCDKSSSQAKKRRNARRCCVPWSRMVPRQHGIAGLECVQHRALRHRTFDLDLDLAADVRQCPKMLRKLNANRYCHLNEHLHFT